MGQRWDREIDFPRGHLGSSLWSAGVCSFLYSRRPGRMWCGQDWGYPLVRIVAKLLPRENKTFQTRYLGICRVYSVLVGGMLERSDMIGDADKNLSQSYRRLKSVLTSTCFDWPFRRRYSMLCLLVPNIDFVVLNSKDLRGNPGADLAMLRRGTSATNEAV